MSATLTAPCRERIFMRIEVKGRNIQVTDELRETAARRFEKVSKQVSDLAVLEIELMDQRTPGNGKVAEATLHLKGVTLRAKDSSQDARHAINLVAEDMARQVKRHRDKRRARREARAAAGEARGGPGGGAEEGPLPAV
jgi:putative sigma-54 modulation protein